MVYNSVVVSGASESSLRSVLIAEEELVRLEVHISNKLNVLFITTSMEAVQNIREHLDWAAHGTVDYDPNSTGRAAHGTVDYGPNSTGRAAHDTVDYGPSSRGRAAHGIVHYGPQ